MVVLPLYDPRLMADAGTPINFVLSGCSSDSGT